ncbi:uncharacterized protein LOC128533245 [Clarias gariepinus]|uniref:uncharacterized protein LOC128533245 n=1 Tax=Clarias gariepinus TaxID=13013 RepID=UPI00234CE27D|nr:uncharacterized protein LOC128533245 [Clarias gariepinus]
MAPTAQMVKKRKSHELEMCKLRLECQREKIDELTRERDYLKEQLALAVNLIDSSSESSSDIMSDSSSKTSSSDRDRKKKRKKRIKMKIKGKTQNPQQVVARYKKILRHFSKGTMSAAFKHVGVDWNTVVVTALIAELYITAPVKYQELLKNHSSQVKRGVFATQCGAAILEDPAIEDTIKTFKASGKLLPLKEKLTEFTLSWYSGSKRIHYILYTAVL